MRQWYRPGIPCPIGQGMPILLQSVIVRQRREIICKDWVQAIISGGADCPSGHGVWDCLMRSWYPTLESKSDTGMWHPVNIKSRATEPVKIFEALTTGEKKNL
jgi:hypothetical protein